MDTVVNVFSQSVDYIRGMKIPSVSEFIPVWFKSKPVDSSHVDLSEIDIRNEPFDSTDSGGGINSIMGKDVNPLLLFIINIILIILYYIFIFILASIVANDLIYMHWTIRLYTFIFVLILCWYTSLGVYPISIYYTIMALYNVYRNYRDKPLDPEAIKQWHPLPIRPRRYAFLPLMTTRAPGILDMLNPFSYFPRGEDPTEPKYANYKYESEKYKKTLHALIPGFDEVKGLYLGTILKRFKRFFYELNQCFLNKAEPEADDEPISNDLEALKENIRGAVYTATGAEKSNEYIQKAFAPT